MKILKSLFLFIIIIIIIYSCGKPPDGINEINIIYLIKDLLSKLNDIKDKQEETLKFFKYITNNFNAIISFYKDTTIYIESQEANPTKDSFIHSLANNKFLTTKAIYLTFEEKDTIYSLDNKTWYSSKSDANKEIEGIKNDYYFYTKTVDNTLYINYKMAFSIGRAPLISNPSEDKNIINLKKDMIFSSTDEKNITMDLKKNILYIPAGTVLSGNVNISGNLINSQSQSDIICIKSIQNMYFYLRSKMFSLSFDKINWNLNILSFNIEPNIEVRSISNNEIFFDIKASAIYEKNKISASIINLLLRAL